MKKQPDYHHTGDRNGLEPTTRATLTAVLEYLASDKETRCLRIPFFAETGFKTVYNGSFMP